MQSEVFDFLLAVHAHLAGAPVRYVGSESTSDLQAVERALPDCDWFELEEIRDRNDAAELQWDASGARTPA